MINPPALTYTRHQPDVRPLATVAAGVGASIFSEEAYAQLLAPLKVRVETSDAISGAPRSSEAWAAGVDGRIYLRPVGGARCPWYRDLLAAPWAAVRVDGVRIPVRALPVTDPERVRKVNEALLARYGYHPAISRLLERSSVAATVELEPLQRAHSLR